MWRRGVPSYGRNSTCNPSATARWANISRSPRQTRSQSSGRLATLKQTSGPMPAGSPEVSAMRGNTAGPATGSAGHDFHVGVIAKMLQPQLRVLIGLARPNGLHRVQPLDLLCLVMIAPPEELRDVPAVM